MTENDDRPTEPDLPPTLPVEADERDTEPPPEPEPEPRLAVTASATTTPIETQRAISDAFTAAWFESKEAPLIETAGMYGRIVITFQRTANALRAEHELEPVQIIAGAVRWLWDFAQRHINLSTDELGRFLERNFVRFEQGGRVAFRSGAAELDDVLLGVCCWLYHFARHGAERQAAPHLDAFGARWGITQLLGYMRAALAAFDDQHGQAMRSQLTGRQ